MKWVLAVCWLSLNACASGAPTRTESAGPPQGSLLILPSTGNACPVEPVGQGCRVLPFEGACLTYLSANEAERRELAQSRYLNLRFAGDHRPFLGPPQLEPLAAHRSLVDSGGSLSALVLLIELLGGPKSELGPDFPSELVLQAVAYGSEHAATELRLQPPIVKLLASVTDLTGVSASWDKATRALSPQVAYHENSGAECSLLLSSLVQLAQDAQHSGRDMYVVQALAHYQPQCQELGGCAGYGCDDPTLGGGEASVCHTAQDQCLQSADCGAPQSCRYDVPSKRWTCHVTPKG